MKSDDELSYYEYELDSYDCTTPFKSSYSTLNWPAFLLNRSIDNIAAVKVLEVSIPTTYYTTGLLISIAETDTTIPSAGVTLDFEIAAGFYSSLTALLVDLISIINATGTTFTYAASIDPITQKIEFTNNMSSVGSYFVMEMTQPQILGYTIDPLATYFSSLGVPCGKGTSTLYIAGSPSYPCVLTSPNIPLLFPTFYYINSIQIGSLINVLLPSNGVFAASTSTLGPQLTKVPVLTQTYGGITFWQDPNPDRWYTVNDYNLTGKLDFFISSSFDINTPLDFNGASFSIKLGMLRKIEQKLIHPNKVISRQMQGDIGKEKKEWGSGSLVDRFINDDDETLVDLVDTTEKLNPGETPQEYNIGVYGEAAPAQITLAVPVKGTNEYGTNRPNVTTTDPGEQKTVQELQQSYSPEQVNASYTKFAQQTPPPKLSDFQNNSNLYLTKNQVSELETSSEKRNEFLNNPDAYIAQLNNPSVDTKTTRVFLDNEAQAILDGEASIDDPDPLKSDDDLTPEQELDVAMELWQEDADEFVDNEKNTAIANQVSEYQENKTDYDSEISTQKQWDTRNEEINQKYQDDFDLYNQALDDYDKAYQEWEAAKMAFEQSEKTNKGASIKQISDWNTKNQTFQKAKEDFKKQKDKYSVKLGKYEKDMQFMNQRKKVLEKQDARLKQQRQGQEGGKYVLDENIVQTTFDENEDEYLNDEEYIDKMFDDQPKMSLGGGGTRVKRRRTRI